MRLKEQERRTIADLVKKYDPEASIYLFGSRADDRRRGGDIDLLILSSRITPALRRKLKLCLYDALGEQKIDIVVSKDLSRAFTRLAVAKGVLI